ncbi:MAG: hypothetical protein JNJ73_02795 [Hyphomonadaceae bacterium]|nr:hypothetical protein [Hyphomonadaceae bacterium]
MTDGEVGIAVLCATVLAFAAAEAWWVTRPFVRARREARKAREEAAGHAAE